MARYTKKDKINIAINFPSNLGDVFLSLPTVDYIKEFFRESKIWAIGQENMAELYLAHWAIEGFISYDKSFRLKDKIDFISKIKKNIDVIADFRHSMVSILTQKKSLTPIIRYPNKKKSHKAYHYLELLPKQIIKQEITCLDNRINLPEQIEKKWQKQITKRGVFLSFLANSQYKSYPYQSVKKLIGVLKDICPIYILHKEYIDDTWLGIEKDENVYNLSGKTRILDVIFLFKKYAQLFVGVDSGLLHIASYLNIPIVALFGPTDEKMYGPWPKSKKYKVIVSRQVDCRPCKKSFCIKNTKEALCMKQISVQEITQAVKSLLKNEV